MAAEKATFSHGRITLSYACIGSGPKKVIAFHGYSRSSADYNAFGELVASSHTVYAFDLFFHGESVSDGVNVNMALSNSELISYFRAFILSLEVKEIGIIAYSMGGRIALALLPELREVKQIVLIAPDGLISNVWYNFAAKTQIGRKLFWRMVQRPKPLYRLARFFKQLRLLSNKTYQVAMENTVNEADRLRLYNTWLFLRGVKVNKAEIEERINGSDLGFLIALGERDKLIPPKLILKWPYVSENEGLIEIIPCGHRMMTNQVFKIILSRDAI